MNNKLLGLGISLTVAIVLMFMVFGNKGDDKDMASSDLKSIKRLISEDKLNEAKIQIDEIKDKNPDLDTLGEIYFSLANAHEKKQAIVEARDIYSLILSGYQNVDNILEVQNKLGRLNMKILFSPIVTDKDVLYKVVSGDTLSDIAKKFGTTIDLIKASNSLKSNMIRINSRFKVSKARYKIFVDKSPNLLTLFSDKNVVVKVYQVSTGEHNSTPVGTFKIINRLKDPVWYNQGAIVPSESPDNILGSRWLGISESGYGIHGTVDPGSVGRQATKGCIRMINPEVEELYTIIPIGTEVTIVD